MQGRISLVMLVAVASCATGDSLAPDATGDDSPIPAGIVAGTPARSAPYVVLVDIAVTYPDGSQNSRVCSASLIGPRHLLSAAHCMHPEKVGLRPRFAVRGDSGRWPRQVVAHVYHPSYQPANRRAGHDVGVLVLDQPVAIPMVALGRTPLVDEDMGDVVRVVGWGTSGSMASDHGTKREAAARLTQLSPVGFEFDPVSCAGDSGGPVLRDGVLPEVVGVVSFGDAHCQAYSVAARVDVDADFIDEVLRTHP